MNHCSILLLHLLQVTLCFDTAYVVILLWLVFWLHGVFRLILLHDDLQNRDQEGEKKHPLSLFLVINKMIMPLTIKQGLLTKEVRKTLSSAIIV